MSRIVESLYGKYGLLDESLNEARNPENDEVNAILKNKIGKARLTKKEQEILDKYGITRDEDGDWIGPNGKRMYKGAEKTVYGPTAPGKYHKSRTWELGNQKGYPKNRRHKDSYDEVDFANYLTKEPTDFNYSQPYRGKAVDNKPYETPAMSKANRPYSDDYKAAKEYRDRNQKWADREAENIMSDDEIEKMVNDYREKLKKRQELDSKDMHKYQQSANENQKEIDDIIARAKAKHQKNESLEDKIPEKDVYGRIIDWPDRFTDKEYKLYQKLENNLFDAIVAEAKFIKKHFNLTDGETVEFMENELKMGGGILDILDANLDE